MSSFSQAVIDLIKKRILRKLNEKDKKNDARWKIAKIVVREAVKRVIPRGEASDVAIDATIRAAAARAASHGEATLEISDEDIREKVRRVRASSLVILVVDASGSMAARRRMEAAKGAALRILANSYTRRDKVAFIAFRGAAAEILLPPTSSVDLAQEALRELPTGGEHRYHMPYSRY
ncbi:MAG: VWA domain-containing protein [Candidatus Bathyarchaeia archaeon]